MQNTTRARDRHEEASLPAIRAPYNITLVIYNHQYVPDDNNSIAEEGSEVVPYCEVSVSNYIIGENNFFKPQKIQPPFIAGNKNGRKKGGMGTYMAGILSDNLTYVTKEFEITAQSSTEETGLDEKTIISIRTYMGEQKLDSLKIRYVEASVRIALVNKKPAEKDKSKMNITVIKETGEVNAGSNPAHKQYNIRV